MGTRPGPDEHRSRVVVAATDREHQVGRAFVGLADTLVADYDVIELLDQLIGHCVALLAADAAAILLADADRKLHLVAASDDDAQTMELLALESGQGPCQECYHSGNQIRVPDVARTAARRDRFRAAVADTAFASVHAIPLRLRGDTIGALGLFHRAPGPLPEADLALGQALADVATIGILSERTIRRGEVVAEQLQSALTSRVVIEQAKGAVAQQLGLSLGAAFALLRRHARANNRRLGELARELVDGITTPDALTGAVRTTPRSPT